MSKVKTDVSVVEVKVQGKQAINELGALELKAANFRAQMDGAKRGTKEFVAASAGLIETKTRMDQLRSTLGLTGMTLSQLIRHQKELSSAIRNTTTYGTAEYKKMNAELQRVNQAVDLQTKKLKGTAGFFSDIKTELKSMAVAGAAVMAGAAVYKFFESIITGSKELSDAITDVEKTTGLTTKQVKELNSEFKKLDTRTPRLRLLELARDAGKMGIKAKEDIAEFVESANMIEVALKEDLGEDAIKNIAKLNDLLGVSEIYGYGLAMEKTGSALNELGANTTAQEAFLVNMTKRLGGIANVAKIAITDIMGLAAATDSLGQTAETSSTAVGMLIVDMFKDTSTYAKIAGLNVNYFNTILANDTNEALIRVFEGLGKSEEGFGKLVAKLKEAGIDGARANQVLSTLAGNTKLIREQQEVANDAFRKGSSIQEEYNKKNQNHAANLERISKWWNGLFTNQTLLTGVEELTKSFSHLVSGADKAALAFDDQKSKIDELDKALPSLMSNYTTLRLKTTLTADEQIDLNDTIRQISLIVPSAVTKLDLYGNALDISTTKVNLFSEAQRAALKILNVERIAEQKQALEDLKKDQEKLYAQLNLKNQNGDVIQDTGNALSSWGIGAQYKVMSDKDLLAKRQELADIEDAIKGRKFLFDQYSGIAQQTPDQNNTGRAGMLGKLAGYGVPTLPGALSDDEVETGGKTKGPSEAEKEAEKALERFQKIQKEITQIQEDLRIQALDKESQDIEKAKAVYLELETELKEHLGNKTISKKEYDAEIARIDEVKGVEINAIKAKYKEERDKVIADNKTEIYEATLEDQELAIQNSNNYFLKLIQIARDYGLNTEALETARLKTIADIRAKYDKKDLKDAVAIANAKMELAKNMSEVIGYAIDLIGKKGEDYNAFQKGLALSQIAIDTAISLSAIIPLATASAAKDGPLAAFTFAGYVAAMAGTVLGAISKARTALSSADDVSYDSSSSSSTPDKKGMAEGGRGTRSFFYGGFTGNKGIGMSDEYGEIAGNVHAREYVLPEMTVSHPYVASLLPAIDQIRKEQISGNPNPKVSVGSDSAESTIILKQMLVAMKNWPTSLRATLLLSELQEAEETDKYLNERYSA